MRTVNNRTAFLDALNMYLPKDCYGVEIGTYRGDFAQMILDVIKPAYLVLVDPFEVNNNNLYGSELNNMPVAYSTEEDYQFVLKRFEKEIEKDKVLVYNKDSCDAVKLEPNNTFDFCYIDSDHRYESVKRDLNDWLPKLKQDGIMGLHDYTGNYELYVIQAVNEFMAEHNFEMIIFNEDGGDWALKRKI